MKRLILTVLCPALLGGACAAGSEERPLEGRLVAASMFKNGLVLVTREMKLDGPGLYRVDEVPEAVHGTLWVEGGDDLEVRVTQREVPLGPGQLEGLDLQRRLAGCEVVVYFREGSRKMVRGQVLRPPEATTDPQWDRNYEPPSPYLLWSQPQAGSTEKADPFLLIQSEDGSREMIRRSMIASLSVTGEPQRPTGPRDVLLLEAGESAGTVRMSYLTKGLSWAPSYRVDLVSADKLRIRQKAVIKNELTAMRDAELSLISGFPSVRFGHVTSPLSLRQSWGSFFRALNAAPGAGGAARGNQTLTQNIAVNNPNRSAPAIPELPFGEGPDIHYQAVGRHSLGEGDSLMLPVAAAEAGYSRIVEWRIPDNRDEFGRPVSDYQRRRDPEAFDDAAWDALRFSNPFDFPMTTAPAAVFESGRFLGQQVSTWVPPKGECTLRVTKALGIGTRLVESEDAEQRKAVEVAGDDYWSTVIEGELYLSNGRNEAVDLEIRRAFSGNLMKADGEPEKRLLEEGAWAANRRNELFWSLPLEPGAERVIKFSYRLLVRR